MIVRFTRLTFQPENAADAKQVYTSEVAPVIRMYPGNRDALFLEPEDMAKPFISCTFWESEEALRAFELSEEYKTVMGKIRVLAVKAEQEYYKVAADTNQPV